MKPSLVLVWVEIALTNF